MAAGKNLTMKVEGNKLVITVDLSKRIGQSASGKSIIVASTGGNVELDGKPGIYAGVNIYEKKSE